MSTTHANRLFAILNSTHGDRYAFLAPLVARSADFIYLSRSRLTHGDWSALQPGCWIEFELASGPNGLFALEAMLITPSLEDRQRRLLLAYSKTHAMAEGVNPRSQRLDGLTGVQAKNLHSRGFMTRDQFYGWMSENGLQSVAKSWGVAYTPGEREAVVRGILAAIEAANARASSASDC